MSDDTHSVTAGTKKTFFFRYEPDHTGHLTNFNPRILTVFYDGSVFNAAIGHLSEDFESSGDSQRWEGCETATLQPGVAGEETNKLTFYSVQQLYPQYGIFGVGSNSLDISVF